MELEWALKGVVGFWRMLFIHSLKNGMIERHFCLLFASHPSASVFFYSRASQVQPHVLSSETANSVL